MSRHTVTPNNSNHSCVVGWDNGLNTFFATIIDKGVEREAVEATMRIEKAFEENKVPCIKDSYTANRDSVVLWVGADRVGEVTSVEDLAGLLEPYAVLSPELLETLNNDRASALTLPRSDHQRQMQKFINENTRA